MQPETLNLETLCLRVGDLARTTGGIIKRDIHRIKQEDLEKKGRHNYVTYVDKMSEAFLVKELSALLPEAGFIAEEGTKARRDGRFRWVIDPLDGTTNYIHALPIYSISIALMDHEETILGVVYEVNLNECFYAWKGSPAYRNGNPIRCSGTEVLDDALLATGFPYTDPGYLEHNLQLLGYLLQNSRGLRRLGSAAVDLAYVACGRFDGFYEYGLNPWDVAAGALIVKQAGGVVSDFRGGADFIHGKEILASNRFLHDNLLDALQTYLR
ncbi:MAG: inositol monophosphatase family protein [Bacteroidales bacterium]|nr:inositol monophosphatase family protein [Bacteroidales bacterium]